MSFDPLADYPVAGFESLPPDLLAAMRGATFCLDESLACANCIIAGAERAAILGFLQIREHLSACRESVLAVKPKLIAARVQSGMAKKVRYHHIARSTAHEAAIAYAERVLSEVRNALTSRARSKADPNAVLALIQDATRGRLAVSQQQLESGWPYIRQHFRELKLPDTQAIRAEMAIEAVAAGGLNGTKRSKLQKAVGIGGRPRKNNVAAIEEAKGLIRKGMQPKDAYAKLKTKYRAEELPKTLNAFRVALRSDRS